VHGGGGDYLDGRNFGNIANLLGYVAKLLGFKIWQGVYS
jgi:hypothetical protein